LIVLETDAAAVDEETPQWVNYGNDFILLAFAGEVCLKLLVYRSSYFKSVLNVTDCVLVFLDVVAYILKSVLTNMPTVSILRIVRLVRLGKSIRFLMLFPELGLMVSALWGTIKSLLWGGLLLLIVLIIFGILAVQLIHPINQEVTASGYYLNSDCERCPRAFESVWMSMLTFFQQILAGDSWGQVSLPISERAPLSWAFFVLVLASLDLMLLNVILAAVVAAAELARSENLEIVAQTKDAERKVYHKRLINICGELDTDGNGTLTFEEIANGFRSHPDFVHLMEAMDIQPDDISFVWGILDADGSGEVNYQEFAEELFKMKMKDAHTMIVFIKYSVAEILAQIRDIANRENGFGEEAPAEAKAEAKATEANSYPPAFAPVVGYDGTHTHFHGLTEPITAPAIPLELDGNQWTDLKAPAAVNLKSPRASTFFLDRELKETLRRIEEKFEKTNELIRGIGAEIPRQFEHRRIPQATTPPSRPSSKQAPSTPWEICSLPCTRNSMQIRADGNGDDPQARGPQPGRP
jgi:voltage-gated sodium channel